MGGLSVGVTLSNSCMPTAPAPTGDSGGWHRQTYTPGVVEKTVEKIQGEPCVQPFVR